MIMLGVIGLLVTLVVAHAVRRQAAAHNDASTPIRMVNPHFFGRDSQGRAYTLGARQASRDEASFQTVLLNYPTVTLDVNGLHPSTLTADSGVYHEDTRILFLKGHVRATSDLRKEPCDMIHLRVGTSWGRRSRTWVIMTREIAR